VPETTPSVQGRKDKEEIKAISRLNSTNGSRKAGMFNANAMNVTTARMVITKPVTVLNSGESAPPGWGLGLYFARKLITAQGGSIGVNSPIWQNTESPGAEFYLLVPIATFSEE